MQAMPTARNSAARALVAVALAATVSPIRTSAAGDPSAEGDAGTPVRFLPMPRTGYVGAFLVCGPLDRRSEVIERGRPAREGESVPADPAGPAGEKAARASSWRLHTAKPWTPGVAFGGYGERGILYAQVELPLDAKGPRHAVFRSSAEVWARATGAGASRETSAKPYEVGQMRLDPGEGSATFLVRLELAGAPVGLAVLYGSATSAGKIAPRPTALNLTDPSTERLARLFADSLAVKLYPVLAREGQLVQAELSRELACPDVQAMPGGALSVEFAEAPPGALTVVESKAGQIGGASDLSKPSFASARYRVPADAPGRYTVTAAISREGKPFATVAASGLVTEGIDRFISRIEEDARKLLGKDGVPQSAVAYALLQAEKARLSFGGAMGPSDPAGLGRDIEAAEMALREARQGRDFQAGKTGFMERAYYSDVDNSAQPYLSYVPTGVRASLFKGDGGDGRRWPMIVYLHGYVPSYDKHAWVGEDRNFNAVMEAEGVILAVPFARSNTDFLTVGEDDVLRVIDEMKREYPVDSRRIYLYGYSMGGSGVWTMLAHYPDMFASALVLAGRSDYYLWHGVRREDFPPWKRSMADCDNPIGLAENIKHIPVRIYHGDSDWVVKPKQSSLMADRLKALGGTAELHWVRGGSHWSLYEAVMWKREPVAWLKRHTAVSPLDEGAPRELVFRAYHLRFARAWGIEVTASRRRLEPVEARISSEGGRYVVRTRNAAGVSTYGPLAAVAERIDVVAEDGGTYVTAADGRGMGAVIAELRQTPLKWKRPCVWGPVKEALRAPFAAVYGTTGGLAEKAATRANAERFVKEWRDFAKGRPPIYADTEVTPDIARARNLVLFGEPDTNAVLRRIAGELPVKWTRDWAEIAGSRYPLRNPPTPRGGAPPRGGAGGKRGLIFLYPNPESPCRLIVVMSGLYWGSELSINHKWDWVPDFIVFEDYKDPLDSMDPSNKAVVAGVFGPDWRFESGRVFTDGR